MKYKNHEICCKHKNTIYVPGISFPCVRVCYIGLAADGEEYLDWGCQNMLRYDDTRWMGGKFIRLENF